ncbi:PDZ domain-containing protein [bacterium]|nr:PDZ domain-containing protein [bacterium]
MRKIIQSLCMHVFILLILFNCSQPTENPNKEQQEEYEYCWQLLDIYFLFRDQLPQADNYHDPAKLFKAADEPYTNYYSRDEAQRILNMLNTEDTGIGIIVDSTSTGYTIEYVVTDSPADQAGLMVKDTIVAVNDVSIQGMPYDSLDPFLSGTIGDKKTLTIHRPDVGEVKIQVILGPFYEPTVFIDSLASNVAYIYLSTFLTETGTPGGSSEEFRTALAQTNWADYTILDLTYNTGGELYQAVQITGEFFHEETPMIIARQRIPDESGTAGITIEDTVRSSFEGNAIGRNFVVLFNEYSASATELLIAALRSLRKDILLIGETTYGKARAQIFASTPMEGLATVTFTLFKPLDGISYDMVGIDPDIPLSADEDGIDLALEQIESGLTKQTAVRSKIRKILALHQHQSRKPGLPLFTRIQ